MYDTVTDVVTGAVYSLCVVGGVVVVLSNSKNAQWNGREVSELERAVLGELRSVILSYKPSCLIDGWIVLLGESAVDHRYMYGWYAEFGTHLLLCGVCNSELRVGFTDWPPMNARTTSECVVIYPNSVVSVSLFDPNCLSIVRSAICGWLIGGVV